MLTILIAEESLALQKAIRIALQGFSIEFLYATNYAQLLQLVMTHPLHLVIADTKLAGLKIPFYLTEHNVVKTPPTIFLFSEIEEKNLIPAIRKGIVFLKKPFSAQDLIFIISEELETPLNSSHDESKPSQLTGGSGPLSTEQLKILIEDYCRQHFKEIADEVLTRELRNLADLNAKRQSQHTRN